MNLDDLNDAQRAAATAADGPLCIVAGPGTGKTKTLTARIAYLVLERQVPARDILALTFTNKAAREMAERVQTMLGKGAVQPQIATFHALAHQMLTTAREELTFIPESARAQLLADLKRSHNVHGISTRELGLLISKAKNELPVEQDIAVVLAAYNAALAEQNLADFDDLLLRFRDRLQMHPLTFRHVLVDEFQDTNRLQYSMLSMLSDTQNIAVIGDPLQSIYGFRGATASIFDEFARDYPGATNITLTTNYRSAPEVVSVANAIFPDAPQLVPRRSQPGMVDCVEVLNEYGEAQWVLQAIEAGIGGSTFLQSSQHHAGSDHSKTFGDFAVLYRTHRTANTVQKFLETAGIPYQIAGEDSPYHQPAVALVLDALRYVTGEAPVPVVKGLKPTQVTALLDPLKAKQVNVRELAADVATMLGVDPTQLTTFTASLLRFEHTTLGEYLAYIKEITEQEFYDVNADAVTLLTIHAAKGLEFDTVFVLACEEGVLPNARHAITDEERRLFYVAVTRAQCNLTLLHARKRAGQPAKVSRFIQELPSAVLPRHTDPQLAAQQKAAHRRAQKRAQTSLF